MCCVCVLCVCVVCVCCVLCVCVCVCFGMYNDCTCISVTRADLYEWNGGFFPLTDGEPPAVVPTQVSQGLYEIGVMWEPALVPMEGPVSNYTASLTGPVQQEKEAAADVTSLLFEGLLPARDYSLTVVASNAYGKGNVTTVIVSTRSPVGEYCICKALRVCTCTCKSMHFSIFSVHCFIVSLTLSVSPFISLTLPLSPFLSPDCPWICVSWTFPSQQCTSYLDGKLSLACVHVYVDVRPKLVTKWWKRVFVYVYQRKSFWMQGTCAITVVHFCWCWFNCFST